MLARTRSYPNIATAQLLTNTDYYCMYTHICIGVNGFFVIAPLSESISLECAFPEGVTGVEWWNGSVPLESISRSTERSNTALISLTMHEDVHGQNYVCRGLDSRGQQVEKQYTALAIGKILQLY